MGNQVTVRVFLNQGAQNREYIPGDGLYEAITFKSPYPACGHVSMLLQIIYRQLDQDIPDTDWALRYQLDGHRTISMGDVIMVGEQAWAVQRRGWKPVRVKDSQFVDPPSAAFGSGLLKGIPGMI